MWTTTRKIKVEKERQVLVKKTKSVPVVKKKMKKVVLQEQADISESDVQPPDVSGSDVQQAQVQGMLDAAFAPTNRASNDGTMAHPEHVI